MNSAGPHTDSTRLRLCTADHRFWQRLIGTTTAILIEQPSTILKKNIFLIASDRAAILARSAIPDKSRSRCFHGH